MDRPRFINLPFLNCIISDLHVNEEFYIGYFDPQQWDPTLSYDVRHGNWTTVEVSKLVDESILHSHSLFLLRIICWTVST